MNVKTIITSSLTAFALLMGFYLLMPLGIDRIEGDELGSTITTINGSDKVKDSRSVINSNFANLNADKLEISAFNATTSLPQITTLANLSSVGTINSGIWNGTRLTVSYGGTGSTTLVQNALLMGNGTNGILAVPAGNDGQVLGLSSGVPTWQSATIDQTIGYTWTGFHTFTSASLASTTITNSVVNYPTASSSIASKGYADSLASCISPTSTSTSYYWNGNGDVITKSTDVYTKAKEFTIWCSGSIKTVFEITNNSGSITGKGRIYVNDVAVGDEYTSPTGAVYGSSTPETINVSRGDRVSVYIRETTASAGNVSIRNFDIYATRTSEPIYKAY